VEAGGSREGEKRFLPIDGEVISGKREAVMVNISYLVEMAHKNAVNHGFWDDPREIGTLLALIHSEVSEALEADRLGDRENFAEELADAVIRIADLAGGVAIDLEAAIVEKMARNAQRPMLHAKRY
jgi:NTP pyrophosphatase (non-canonical NTP hydrolase)